MTHILIHKHTHTPLWVVASPCLFAPADPPIGGWSSQHRPVASFAHDPPRLPEMTGLYSATFPVTSWLTRPCKQENKEVNSMLYTRSLKSCLNKLNLNCLCLIFTWQLVCVSVCLSSTPFLQQSSSGGRALWLASHTRHGGARSSPLSFLEGKWAGFRGQSNRIGIAGWDRAGFWAHLAKPGWCTEDAGGRETGMFSLQMKKWAITIMDIPDRAMSIIATV